MKPRTGFAPEPPMRWPCARKRPMASPARSGSSARARSASTASAVTPTLATAPRTMATPAVSQPGGPADGTCGWRAVCGEQGGAGAGAGGGGGVGHPAKAPLPTRAWRPAAHIDSEGPARWQTGPRIGERRLLAASRLRVSPRNSCTSHCPHRGPSRVQPRRAVREHQRSRGVRSSQEGQASSTPIFLRCRPSTCPFRCRGPGGDRQGHR